MQTKRKVEKLLPNIATTSDREVELVTILVSGRINKFIPRPQLFVENSFAVKLSKKGCASLTVAVQHNKSKRDKHLCLASAVLRLHIKLIFGKHLESVQFHLRNVEGLKSNIF